MSETAPELQSAIAIKLETAKQKKETGDQAFKNGDVKAALLSYHEALMYLLGLDKNALQSIGVGPSATPQKDKDGKEIKEKTEVDDIIEKIYANMSACHMKNGNWQRVLDTAQKAALDKNENNYKVQLRKAKALGEQGYIEKAVKILEDIKGKNPSDAAIYDAELSRLRVIDNERDKASKAKLKGFLNREKKSDKTEEVVEDKLVAVQPPPSATIEEVA
ncbi:Tetratricopeptide repeat protein 9C [Termitomyces sp. J132]|nr:Tetratricopeptide repeat protein 9C [Termitomyces sp. J132]